MARTPAKSGLSVGVAAKPRQSKATAKPRQSKATAKPRQSKATATSRQTATSAKPLRAALTSAGARVQRAVKANPERNARQAVIDTARAMSATGLSPGRSGNVSLRWGEGMLITPSGMAYDALTPEDVVFVSADGETPGTARKPSSEWQFHLSALAARPDRHAVVHTHSEHATVLACRHEPIPAFHYMVAVAGGADIPCIPYATFGTKKLARFVADGLAKRDAVLMANHGQIAIAETLSGALELAREVETLAAQYVQVLALGGPKILSAKEMKTALKRFRSYGQNAQSTDND